MAEQHTAPVKGGAVPYVTVEGALKASKFYEKAFGAEVAASHPPDEKGRTMHVHLYVNGSSMMLSDPYPDHGHPFVPHAGFSIVLIVNDVDSWYSRAVAAGCTESMPPQDMFWGDRFGTVKDPFGVVWSMNGPAKK